MDAEKKALERLTKLEAQLQSSLAESAPQNVAAISAELRRIWADMEALQGVDVDDDDRAARVKRVEAARVAASAAGDLAEFSRFDCAG